ncbi:hypothetical protein MBTS_00725, partial [Methylobacterium bullatum]
EDTARAAEEWEPIEGAPEGWDILILVGKEQMVACYLTQHPVEAPGWYIYDGHAFHILAAGTPTHWRPLPALPPLYLNEEA